MPFELDHDWRATFANPRPRIGEAAKTRLLLLLCAIWLLPGLIGHQPWKPDEPQTMSIVKHMLTGGDLFALHLAGTAVQNSPLYYLSATASAALFSPWFSMHDAARLISLLWMTITLLALGLAGRELWGKGWGRQTTLVFISSIGLVVSAHLLTPALAVLTGYAITYYALTQAVRRPLRAGILLGLGGSIALLSGGGSAVLAITLTMLVLPIHHHWRQKAYAACAAYASFIVLAVGAVWLWWLFSRDAQSANFWLTAIQPTLVLDNPFYFIKTLTWYAWPALPLALWLAWKERIALLQQPQLLLSVVYFIAMLVTFSLSSDSRDSNALPLLLPLAVLGAGAIDTLKRGAASALDWFGITLFGMLGFLIWLGWIAMMTGFPAKTAERMQKLSPAYDPQFSWSIFLAALGITIIWLFVIGKNKRSNRAIVTDWAVGITLAWGLLTTLWLPWLDAIKSYRGMVASMSTAMPQQASCIATRNLGNAQRATLDYYTNLRVEAFKNSASSQCSWLIIQDEKGRPKFKPSEEWTLIWQGKRPSDRRESFRLFQRAEASTQ